MTTETTGTLRTNRDGNPCPPWCTTDHDRLVISDKPQFGYMDGHFSDYVAANGEAAVKLSRDPHEEILVRIDRLGQSGLTVEKAEELAAFLASAPVGLAELAGQLRAAAAIAREAA